MSKVVFLCQHGGAKSVIAASYFNQAGLPFEAVAASVEEPYEEVPAPVVGLLRGEGVDVSDFKPRRVEGSELDDAVRVVTIGCDLSGVPGSQPGTGDGLRARRSSWDDVLPASEDLHGSADAIRRHVDALVAELREQR